MGSLYIGGAQCKTAQFADEADWKLFDAKEAGLEIIAKNSNVAISRHSLDDGGIYSFVVKNVAAKYLCFYEGAAFEYDMSVKVSDDFDVRANKFIAALNASAPFKKFHNLDWSETKVLYFVTS